VKTVQKIDPKAYIPDQVSDQRSRWCGLLANVPPFTPPRDPAPPGMTSGQAGVWNSQIQPENQWFLHPAIDGCQPGEPPPRDPVPR
jgi:hypothetical protein